MRRWRRFEADRQCAGGPAACDYDQICPRADKCLEGEAQFAQGELERGSLQCNGCTRIRTMEQGGRTYRGKDLGASITHHEGDVQMNRQTAFHIGLIAVVLAA